MTAPDLAVRAPSVRADAGALAALTAAAIVTALLAGGLVMLVTGVPAGAIGRSYLSLAEGSLGSAYAASETLTAAAPLILAGLGIALGFRAGLFNIGAEGQILAGGVSALVVGFSMPGLPTAVHLPLALLAGAAGGGLWGLVPGWLRASTGAHEVITTIMMNFVALRLVDFLLRNPPVRNPERSDPISRYVLDTAALPRLLGAVDPQARLDAGILIAAAMAALTAWLLFRTTIGFEVRAAGANPAAARYAGIRLGRTVMLTMTAAGALAGLAGAVLILGVLGRASPGFSAGLGFEAIAVALLGRSHPAGVVLAGLLFGALEAGGRQMQARAAVSLDLITIIQALIVVFIAAPVLLRALYPFLRRPSA